MLEDGIISGLLVGEGIVGRYGELLKLGRRGDNLTPHHLPANAYMVAKASGYMRNQGIAIMMEHPTPGAGGRHRQTLSYGKSPDLRLLPRQVLARETQDLRSIYQHQGVYNKEMKHNLRSLVPLNKSVWISVLKSRSILYESEFID